MTKTLKAPEIHPSGAFFFHISGGTCLLKALRAPG